MEGFAQDARYLYFILEFVSGGELLTYLRNNVRFESSQAAYVYRYLGSMRRKLCLYSNTFTIKILSLEILSLKIF